MQVRFDLIRSRLMDINVMNWSDDFFMNCGMDLIDETRMHIKDVRHALSTSKLLTLFGMQITNLIGHAEIDERQTIDIVSFGKDIKALIERMYTVEPMRRKA